MGLGQISVNLPHVDLGHHAGVEHEEFKFLLICIIPVKLYFIYGREHGKNASFFIKEVPVSDK